MLKPLSIGLVVTGLVILVVGVILGWVVAPNLIEKMVEDQTQLKNNTDIYEKWVNIPIPIYLKFYFFNITNYEDYLGMDNWGAKPNLTEVGPYVYKEKREKYDIQSNSSEDSVTFRSKTTYTFVPEMSAGLDTDTINTINVPLLSVATVLYTMESEALPLPAPVVMNLLTGPLSRERLVKMNVTVHEVIFGWKLNFIYNLVEELGGQRNITFPPELQHGQFGYYLDRNATNADGQWEVYSGIKDSSKFNVVKNIDGKNRLDEWWTDHCAMINGTDGTMFPPFIKKTDLIYAYGPEICRSIWLTYKEETEYEGIPGYRFEVPKELFTSPLTYPANQCFCLPIPEPLNNTCNFNGGGRLFSCKSGAPIIISKPHFLDADEVVFDYVIGLKPDRLLHDSHIDIEPTTGFPLSANKRLQIGLETQPLPKLGGPWGTMQHMLFPAIWADEEANLDEALVDEIKSKLINPLKLVKIGKWSVVGIGCFVTIAGAIYFSYITWWKR